MCAPRAGRRGVLPLRAGATDPPRRAATGGCSPRPRPADGPRGPQPLGLRPAAAAASQVRGRCAGPLAAGDPGARPPPPARPPGHPWESAHLALRPASWGRQGLALPLTGISFPTLKRRGWTLPLPPLLLPSSDARRGCTALGQALSPRVLAEVCPPQCLPRPQLLHVAIVCAGHHTSRDVVTLVKSLLFYRYGQVWRGRGGRRGGGTQP